jgi:HD-like signal output (HDOD) protein
MDVAKIVERDGAMSAKVLQLVNSAYFGSSQKVSAIRQAVQYLGADLLRGLALSAHVFATADLQTIPGFSLVELQKHALGSGFLAKKFLGDSPEAADAFTAAIVHDVGEIVLAVGMPLKLGEVLATEKATGRPRIEIEREILGATHAEIGAYLLGIWGLPFSIVEAVAHHHDPSRVAEGACEVLAAAHVASALVDHPEAPVDEAFLARAGFAPKLAGWRKLAREAKSQQGG